MTEISTHELGPTPLDKKTSIKPYWLGHQEDTKERLRRYRGIFKEEVSTQLERIGDIARALENLSNGAEINARPLQILIQSLANAQMSLRDAILAKERIDMELESYS